MKATRILELICEAQGKLTPEQLKQQAKAAMESIDGLSDRLQGLIDWIESKDFHPGDIDGIGDFYKDLTKRSGKYPDWDEAISYVFNESHVSNKIFESIFGENTDLDRVRSEIENIQKQLAQVKEQIKKEKEAGKGDNILDGLKKKWQDLQSKIVTVWKSYDQKHGTKYAQAYQD